VDIWVRTDDPVPDDTEVLIHMGTGPARLDDLLDRSVVDYDAYRGVLPTRPDRGAFVLSTFAPVNGVTERDILREMRQNQFARATFGQVREHFAVYPTSMATGLDSRIMAAHFDIGLPDEDCTVIDAHDSTDLPADVEAQVKLLLRPRLEQLLALFRPFPRLDKRKVMGDLP
jgi:hypothetical protein